MSVMPAEEPHLLIRPTLDESVKALLLTDSRFPWVKPTDEEADAAELIRHISDTHRGSSADCDNPEEPNHFNRTWGGCTGCEELWPCGKWAEATELAVQFVGRAADRYVARAQAAWDSRGSSGQGAA